MKSDDDMITVCAACQRATCYQYLFCCDGYKTADLKQVTRGGLRKLALEHECYWKTDSELAAQRVVQRSPKKVFTCFYCSQEHLWQQAEDGWHSTKREGIKVRCDDPKIMEKYDELIMAVSKKCPGETRHQTALKYIQRAEHGSAGYAAGRVAGLMEAQGDSVRCCRCGGSGYTQSDDPARPLSRCGTCQGDGIHEP